MPKPLLTPEICSSAGRDAGNRSMRAAGRSKWNEDDYNTAATETNRLFDLMEGRPQGWSAEACS